MKNLFIRLLCKDVELTKAFQVYNWDRQQECDVTHREVLDHSMEACPLADDHMEAYIVG